MDIEAELRDLTARRDIYDALCRYMRGIAGRYNDRYEDRGDGWKTAKRRESIDWARAAPRISVTSASGPEAPSIVA